MQRFSVSDWPRLAEAARRPFHERYFAMYSSVYGGVVTDPALMLVPIDDHMVHRGDGVFEAFKCAGGALYNLHAHLGRLERSAAGLGLAIPASRGELENAIVETVRAGERRDAIVRLFLSRGPGSFSANPFDCPRPEWYIVVTAAPAPFMERRPEGASVGRSAIPAKDPFFAAIKSCNYLPNVLMTREAQERGLDVVVAYDSRGRMTEGATENLGIVTPDRRLRFPPVELMLQGTTMLRVMELARTLTAGGPLRAVEFADIREDDVFSAAELLILSTTKDVAAAVLYEGRPVGDGRPGPVYRALAGLFRRDVAANSALRTPVWHPPESGVSLSKTASSGWDGAG